MIKWKCVKGQGSVKKEVAEIRSPIQSANTCSKKWKEVKKGKQKVKAEKEWKGEVPSHYYAEPSFRSIETQAPVRFVRVKLQFSELLLLYKGVYNAQTLWVLPRSACQFRSAYSAQNRQKGETVQDAVSHLKTYENHWKPTLGVPKLFITREWYRGINCATGTRRCVYSELCPVATFCNMYQYVAFACVCGMRSQCGLQHERVLAGSRKSRCQRCCNDALQSPSREWSWTSQATLSQRAHDTKSTGKDCKAK